MKTQNLLAAFCLLLLTSAPLFAAGTGTVVSAVDPKTGLSKEWTKWFAADDTLRRIDGAPYPVYAVTATTGGKTNGWVFRTDQVPPQVKGMGGEIGVMVGLGTDGLIKGVHVEQNHETPRYFSRLTDTFYAQFPGKPAGQANPKVDTVTHSTVSSRAIIQDVFLSSQTVIALPEVNPLLKFAPAPAAK